MLQTIVGNIEQKLKESENLKILRPVFGMLINEENELRDYTNYAKEEGVGVTTGSSYVGVGGTLKYLTCSRSEIIKVKQKIPYILNRHKKQDIKTRINASICLDGKVRLTTALLEDNHFVSPGMARYCTSN